jgi:uncharacterized protein (DUF1810 family)
MDDPYNLKRFVDAQNPVYEQVRSELKQGRKRTHWMWFVFPQIAGLGSSHTARKYAIASLDEARAYLNHPVLGPRLVECTQFVNQAHAHSIDEIFGYPDDLKFRSCMTLFARATADNHVFRQALETYFGGEADPQTEALL